MRVCQRAKSESRTRLEHRQCRRIRHKCALFVTPLSLPKTPPPGTVLQKHLHHRPTKSFWRGMYVSREKGATAGIGACSVSRAPAKTRQMQRSTPLISTRAPAQKPSNATFLHLRAAPTVRGDVGSAVTCEGAGEAA
jgi:hypothetical protein